MTECCLFVCCRTTTPSRLVAVQFADEASGYEDDLHPKKLKTLLSYCLSYPRKLPIVCQVLGSRIEKEYKRKKKGFVVVGFKIFRGICEEMHNQAGQAAVDIIEPYFSNSLLTILSGNNVEYRNIAYDGFVDYTEYCNPDVSKFVVPIENMCLLAKSCRDIETPLISLKYLLRLINVIMYQVGDLEAYLDIIVPIVYYYYANASSRDTKSGAAVVGDVYVDDDGSLTVRSAAEACFVALSTTSSSTALVQMIACLFSVFDTSSWEPSEAVQKLLALLENTVTSLNVYQAPVAHAVLTHARNIALGTSAAFNPARPTESSPVPVGVISRPESFHPALTVLSSRTLQGSEAVLRTLRAKCVLLRNVLDSAAVVLRLREGEMASTFRPMLLYVQDDWKHLIELANFCSPFMIDVCPPLLHQILSLAERCGKASGGETSFEWLVSSGDVYQGVGTGGECISRQISFDVRSSSAGHESITCTLSVLDGVIKCMRLVVLSYCPERCDVVKRLLEQLCRAIFSLDNSDDPRGRRVGGGAAVVHANRVILLFVMSSLLDTLLQFDLRPELGSPLLVTLRSVCLLCRSLSHITPDSTGWANSALTHVIIEQIVLIEEKMGRGEGPMSDPKSPFSEPLVAGAGSADNVVASRRRLWQHRNIVLRDAIFSVLCSHSGEGRLHEGRVAAVWGLQELLLNRFGYVEVSDSLPFALALDDFCQSYPLDLMHTKEAVVRSFQVIGGIQAFLWAYLNRLQSITDCDLSPFCSKLKESYSRCRDMSTGESELTLSGQHLVLVNDAPNRPSDSTLTAMGIDRGSDVSRHAPPAIDREAILTALLKGATGWEDGICEAFASPYEPVADLFDRLGEFTVTRGAEDTITGKHSDTARASASLPVVGESGRSLGQKAPSAAAPSTLTDTDIRQFSYSHSEGGVTAIHGALDRSGNALNRDTMMHPTKLWVEKCDHFTRLYSGLLDSKGSRLSSADIIAQEDARHISSGRSNAAIIREIDNLQLM